jgi:hypothetical protein
VSFTRQALGIALLFSAAVEAADPPAAASSAAPAPTVTTTRAPLNLQVGDVRKYMMPNEYRAAINVAESDRTIVVEGERAAPPLKSTQPIPGGLATPFWMLAHPLNAWRALLPDPNAPPSGPPDVVPKREFRWGP